MWQIRSANPVNIRNGLTSNYPFNGNAVDLTKETRADVLGPSLCLDRFDRENSAYQFDGKDDYIEIKKDLNFKNEFSFCFWINAENSHAEQTLFLKGEGCPDGNPYYNGSAYSICLLPDNTISAKVIAPEGNHFDEFIFFTSVTRITPGEWTFIVVSYDNVSKEFSLYINGKLSVIKHNYKSLPDNFSGIYETKASLKIGAEENYCAYVHKYGSYFKGMMDDIKIYDRVINEGEVSVLYDKPYSIRTILLCLLGLLIFVTGVIHIRKYTKEGRDWPTIANPLFINWRTIVIFSSALIYMYYIVFSQLSNFSDTAYFGGDTWEYQSMAVNFSKGHGLQKFGGLEPFDQYKFDTSDSLLLSEFVKEAGSDNFYRTPIYPFFVGAIYKLVGISPSIVKHIQLLLLIIIASLLPWVGYYFWNKQGFASGLVAGAIFMVKYFDMAGNLLTEPLITFSLFLILIAYIYFDYKKNIISSIILGAAMGTGLLVKGSLIFVPILFLLYLFFRAYQGQNRRHLIHAALFISSLILTLAPWSTYASIKSGSFILLSTQGDILIKDSNNENTADGLWHPEWRKEIDQKEKYFYNNSNSGSIIFQVFKFYTKYPQLICTTVKNKLIQGFSSFLFLWIFWVVLFIECLSSLLTSRYKVSNNILVWHILTAPLMIVFSFYFILYPTKQMEFIADQFNWILLGTFSLFLMMIAQRKTLLLKMPAIFYIFIINFLILTIITYGSPRFIEVIDFIFILCAVHYVFALIWKSFKAVL